VSPQMLQQRLQEVSDIKGLEVTRLEADVDPQVLALGRYREGGQRRDTVMSITVRDNGRVPLGSPRPAVRGDEQKATLIQEGYVGPQAAGFFLWRAICSASNAQWPVRHAESPGAPAPDSSSPSGARPSRRATGDSVPQSAPESSPQCAVRSTARWETHGHGPPAARAGATARIADRATCVAGRAPPWGPRRLRRRSARSAAIEPPSSPMLVPGVPPRSA